MSTTQSHKSFCQFYQEKHNQKEVHFVITCLPCSKDSSMKPFKAMRLSPSPPVALVSEVVLLLQTLQLCECAKKIRLK